MAIKTACEIHFLLRLGGTPQDFTGATSIRRARNSYGNLDGGCGIERRDRIVFINQGFGIIGALFKRLLKKNAPVVLGIPSTDYPTPAKRPVNSILSSNKLRDKFGIQPPAWQDALVACLEPVNFYIIQDGE